MEVKDHEIHHFRAPLMLQCVKWFTYFHLCDVVKSSTLYFFFSKVRLSLCCSGVSAVIFKWSAAHSDIKLNIVICRAIQWEPCKTS